MSNGNILLSEVHLLWDIKLNKFNLCEQNNELNGYIYRSCVMHFYSKINLQPSQTRRWSQLKPNWLETEINSVKIGGY